MNIEIPKSNPAVEMILSKIDPAILESFSQEQLTAIKAAVQGNLPNQKSHALEVRGTIPLFFRRLYFVFAMGRDVRKKTEDVYYEIRAKNTAKDALTVATSFLVVLVIFASLVLGYIGPLIYR